jgi:hypothetical protein
MGIRPYDMFDDYESWREPNKKIPIYSGFFID